MSTPETRDEPELCSAAHDPGNSGSSYYCTLHADHEGDHEAWGFELLRARWPQPPRRCPHGAETRMSTPEYSKLPKALRDELDTADFVGVLAYGAECIRRCANQTHGEDSGETWALRGNMRDHARRLTRLANAIERARATNPKRRRA